jgi:hypothetical protein
MTHDPTRDCEHGRLKGKCDVCDLQAEAEADKTIIEYHEATIKRLQYEVDAIPAIKEERDALAAELTRLKASIALDKMAENARELGLSYEPAPVQEGRDWSLLEATQESLREHMAEIKRLKAAQPVPVKTYFDGKPWPVAPKPWVGLSEKEVEAYDSWADFQVGCGRQTLFDMVRDIETKLKEKNHDQ